jgi:hypothetical protein
MENKFQSIQIWIPSILGAIKKEIRTDHLASSPAFARAHFGNRPLNRLTTEEIFKVYEKELLAGQEDLSEWVVNRWVFKHGDIYQHFAERLGEIQPDFGNIERLDEGQSEQILAGAPEAFGALQVYLFSYLNGVVFPEKVFAHLRALAEKEERERQVKLQQEEESQSMAEALESAKRECLLLQQKYEAKMAGLMKKYTTDVEALKKQIRSLQQQLHAAKR